LKNGEDGKDGLAGKDGPAGRDGLPGRDGKDGKDGQDGQDGQDGVSVVDARIDFDGSLVITLSTGREMNVGEVVAPDLAEKIKLVTSGGSTSQQVLDTLVDLQDQINVLTGIDGTLGTMAQQDANAVAITGGTINGVPLGTTTPAAGTFTTLTSTGQANIGTGFARYLIATGSASGSPGMYATGGSLTFSGGGGAGVNFYSNLFTALQLNVAHTASAVNFVQATGAATGSGPVFSAQGSDTNIDLNLTPKGAGVVVATGGTLQAGTTGSNGNLNLGGVNVGLRSAYSANVFGMYTNNAEQMRIGNTASAVNFLQAAGGATGNSPNISAQGSDANINLAYSGKGTFGHAFYTNNFNQLQFAVSHTNSAVNFVQVTGAATGGRPLVSVQGSDTNINVGVLAKGSGVVYLQSGLGASLEASATGNANYFSMVGTAAGTDPVLTVKGSDTNIDLVLSPKGTGALQAQQTDSTATGGNARGANAVDWQTARNAASQVANGLYSVIGGGLANTSSGTVTTVAGGTGNAVGGTYAGILSGISNAAAGYGAVIGGGYTNIANGFYNFIGTGFSNSGTANAAVTTQTGTMNGTTAVTLSGSNASIRVGQLVGGTSIQAFPHTYVAAISGTSLTLSQAASGSSTSTLSFFTPHGVVVGGGNNQATGSYSFIGGGGDAGTAGNRNVASGAWSAVVGGNKNVASGIGAFIGGNGGDGAAFYQNTASGTSSAIVCGTNNTVTSVTGFIGAGVSSGVTGGYGFVGAGAQNTVNSSFGGIVAGFNGNTRGIVGNHVFPACANPIANATGVSQAALLILGKQTTDATPTVLVCETSAPTTNNQVILPNNSAYFFRGEVVSGVTGGGNTKGWTIEGVIKRGANAASTTLVGTPTVTSSFADAGASTWVIAVTADTTNGGLAVTFTGQAGTTIRVVAQIRTTEMTF
jgi:hypothetical protein